MATETAPRFDPVESYQRLSATQKRRLIRVTSLFAVLGSWEFVGRAYGDLILAPFSQVVVTYVDWTFNSQMFPMLFTSLREAMLALAIAIVVGIPIGLLMGRDIVVESVLRPWVEMFFVAATASLLPLFIVLFGIDFLYRFVIIFYAALTVIILNVYHGAKAIDPAYVEVARSFGASRMMVLKDIILPASLPHVLVALRLGILTSVKVMILAGMFITHGYGGFLIRTGQQTLSTAPVIVLVINLMILVLVLRKIMNRIRRRVAPWYDLV